MDPYSLKYVQVNNNTSTPSYIAKPNPTHETVEHDRQNHNLIHKKKKIQCVIGPPAPNNNLSINTELLTPEHDKEIYSAAPREIKQIGLKKKDHAQEQHNEKRSELNVRIKDSNNVNLTSNLPNMKLKTTKNKIIRNGSEKFTNDNLIDGVKYHDFSYATSKKIDYSDIQSLPLLCKTINYKGEAVKINNDIVENKVILSCYPKGHHQKEYFINPTYKKEMNSHNSYPQTGDSFSDFQFSTDIHNINESLPDQRGLTNKSTNPVTTHENNLEEGQQITEIKNMNQQYKEQNTKIYDNDKNYKQYEEQNRYLQCKSYKRNFTSFLWCLFIINVILIFVGLILLLLTLYHSLFHTYINTVIGNNGSMTWVWLAMILSLFIIIVGVYGVVTAITRARMTIIVYLVIATITAALILLYLLVLWFIMSSIHFKKEESMRKTLSMYRCHLWIKHGWDDLQRNYKCCGVNSDRDWKYIPSSCCQASTKFEKLSCITDYIHHDRAYKDGCRSKMDDYFLSLFILITCLLILAFILLILGILAAMRLNRTYKLILYCKNVYRTGKTSDNTCFT